MYNKIHKQNQESFITRFWLAFTTGVGIVGWGVVFIILSIIDSAKPPDPSVIEKTLNIKKPPLIWNYKLLSDAWMLMVVLLVICIIALLIRLAISRKKSGPVFISLLLLIILTIIGMIAFQYRFS